MNFLDLYREYATEITDAHENYHDYVALATVGIAIGNNCYLPFGDTRIYPNIWLILLGDSSYSRKTTAINIGKRLISEALPERIYPNEFSQERIQTLLEKQPCGCFFFSEFVTLMGLLSRDYLSGTKGFLADLFDSPFTYKRETEKKTIKIDNPAISIISATTTSWFTEKMKESDIMGGFIPRFLMVMPTAKTKSISLPPEADREKRKRLVHILSEFQKINGICFIKDDARAYFDSWYQKLATFPGNGRVQPFLQRLQVYTLKFAMIFNIIDDNNLKISVESMEKAVSLVYKLCRSMAKVESEELVFGRVQGNMKKITDYLRKHGETPRSTMLVNTRLSSKEFGEAVQTLVESEQVTEYKIKTTRRPLQMYSLRETKEDSNLSKDSKLLE